MTTTIKTPIQVIQEIIAIHTTRKEVVQKLKEFTSRIDGLPAAEKQSDEFIAALLNELSNYGDGVSPMVDRDNEYQQTWKNALSTIDTATVDEQKELFLSMEKKLKEFYNDILKTQKDLPPSTIEILHKQNKLL
ncbi:MAG: hypothetical protein ABIN67_15980 [Ferruginibacter sp.]